MFDIYQIAGTIAYMLLLVVIGKVFVFIRKFFSQKLSAFDKEAQQEDELRNKFFNLLKDGHEYLFYDDIPRPTAFYEDGVFTVVNSEAHKVYPIFCVYSSQGRERKPKIVCAISEHINCIIIDSLEGMPTENPELIAYAINIHEISEKFDESEFAFLFDRPESLAKKTKMINVAF